MGCFDFTYADNGENIVSRQGFLYTTKQFQDRTKTRSPLRFLSTNEYGMFQIRIKDHFVYVDIYALLAAQVYLTGTDKIAGNTLTDTDVKNFERFLNCLKQKKLPFDTEPDSSSFQNSAFNAASDGVRNYGIQYFFAGCQTSKPVGKIVPALGNQKIKKIDCPNVYKNKIPILISKKKLPGTTTHSDSIEIAENWGFVSCDDPNQGFFPTKNRYNIYKP